MPAPSVPELVLAEHRRWPIPVGPAPVAIAALDTLSIWVLQAADRRIHQLAPNGDLSAVGSEADTGFALIAPGRGRVLAVRDSTVYEINPNQPALLQLLAVPSSRGRIVGLTELDRAIILVLHRDSSARVVAVASTTPAAADGAAIGEWVGSSVRVEPASDSAFLVSRMLPPYTVSEVLRTGAQRWRAEPAASDLSGSANAQIASLAALPLDCGRTLQVPVDMRSDARWLLLYDAGEFARARPINRPIGFTHVVDRRFLLGFDDSPDEAAVVLYRWRWEPFNSE